MKNKKLIILIVPLLSLLLVFVANYIFTSGIKQIPFFGVTEKGGISELIRSSLEECNVNADNLYLVKLLRPLRIDFDKYGYIRFSIWDGKKIYDFDISKKNEEYQIKFDKKSAKETPNIISLNEVLNALDNLSVQAIADMAGLDRLYDFTIEIRPIGSAIDANNEDVRISYFSYVNGSYAQTSEAVVPENYSYHFVLRGYENNKKHHVQIFI